MSQSARSEARLKVQSQLMRRHEELMAREARIRTEVLDAAAAILNRDRAVREAEARLGQALDRLTSGEGMPVDEAAELCGLDAREGRRLIRATCHDGTVRQPAVLPDPRRNREVER